MNQTLSGIIHHAKLKKDGNGTFLINQYKYNKNVDILGQGAFGTVYKSIDQKNGKLVAIKIMNLSLFVQPYMKQQLKNEILLMMNLNSPHVVKILEVLTDNEDRELYIIMEFCDGGDLRHKMVKFQRFTELEAIEILSQFIEGFKDIVKLGYIHRDIKPENCLFNRKQLKIADFGLAAKIDFKGKQLLKEQVGTPLYMAPQILKNESYGPKCDIWSIGLMYYEMLVGSPPWPFHDMRIYCQSIKTNTLKFPYGQQISQLSKQFIRQCLTIDESNRIGWDQLFSHPLITQHTQNYPQKLVKQPTLPMKQINFSENERQILAHLQEKCEQAGVQPHLMLKTENNKSCNLNFLQFYSILQKIDRNFTQIEANTLFKKFDLNGDKSISCDEFCQIFSEFDFSNVNDLVKNVRNTLKKVIDRQKIDLSSVYKHMDRNQSGYLDKDEFFEFIRIILPGLPFYDLERLFNFYDVNGDKKISFEEFQKGIGINQSAQNSCDIDKANRVLRLLQNVIREQKIDLMILFKKFDRSGDGYLDVKELFVIIYQTYNMFTYIYQQQMLARVENDITEIEVIYLFQLIDVKKIGKINFSQFQIVMKS